VSEKRTEVVTVRLTARDMELLQSAAEVLWPGAVITKSGLVLGLARMMADDVLDKRPK
jgi:hypothetical protein